MSDPFRLMDMWSICLLRCQSSAQRITTRGDYVVLNLNAAIL